MDEFKEEITSAETEATALRRRDALTRSLHMADLGTDCLVMSNCCGLDLSRRGNLMLIEDQVVIYAISNAVVFENISSGKKKYLLGLDETGVGCVAVHPSRNFFAVGGKGFNPKIYVYSYPEMEVRKILTGGAERGYAYLNFSAIGSLLASLSMAPDYMLTVWDWMGEKTSLHSKAFGQDVFFVKFSLDDERRLTSSGTGHIRFWKMAATFTGLKLQGHIGKFGKIELSDIAAFVELPDGKVLSGTESGALLLWEGNFIKCRFVKVGGAPCHVGEVTYVEFDRKDRCVITAGMDGVVNWWDFDAIDGAEVDSDNSMDFELMVVASHSFGASGIKTVVDSGVKASGDRSLLVVDAHGNFKDFNFADSASSLSTLVKTITDDPNAARPIVSLIGSSHAGKIAGMDVSPTEHVVVTGGEDCTLRCWDYLARKLIGSRSFSVAIVSVCSVPLALENTGRSFLVGFADGTARVFQVSLPGKDTVPGSRVFSKTMVFKPHDSAVVDLAFSNDQGRLLATSGKDGAVFFFYCAKVDPMSKAWQPVRFINMRSHGDNKTPLFCEKISWRYDDKVLLCSCSDSSMREVDVSCLLWDAAEEKGDVTTFEAFYSVTDVYSCAAVSMAPIDPNGGSAAVDGSTEVAIATTGDSSANRSLVHSDSSASLAAGVKTVLKPMKMGLGVYSPAKPHGDTADIGESNSLHSHAQSIISGAAAENEKPGTAALRQCLVEFSTKDYAARSARELPMGVYAVDEKNGLKFPRVTSLRSSLSKKFLVVGTADGSVILRPTSQLETFARAVAHNGAIGGVSAVATSFDDRFLISAGFDGLVVVHKVDCELIEKRAPEVSKSLPVESLFTTAELKKVDPPTSPNVAIVLASDTEPSIVADEIAAEKEKAPDPDEVPDIEPGAYSIQEAKLKSENEAKLIAAGELKDEMREAINILRKDFEYFRNFNAQLPDCVRLSDSDMAVDGEYIQTLEQDRLALVEEVHRECEYNAEKAMKLRSKLIRRLMDGLLEYEMPLHAFNKSGDMTTRALVKSFRTQAIGGNVKSMVADIQASLKKAEFDQTLEKANEAATQRASAVVLEFQMKNNAKKNDANHDTHHNLVSRRELRRLRQTALEKHQQEKPSEDADDERDLQAIMTAEKTMGDIKLKCAENYEVPEELRMNASKKLRQMAVLEDGMVAMRLQFNERFFDLRELKRLIILAIRRDNERIREIDIELHQSLLSAGACLWEPELDPGEYLDDFEEVTDEELKQYIAAREAPGATWAKVPPPRHLTITGSKSRVAKNPDTGTHDTAKRQPSPEEVAAESTVRLDLDAKFTRDVLPQNAMKIESRYRPYEVRDDFVLSAFTNRHQQPEGADYISELEKTIPVLIFSRDAKKRKMYFRDTSDAQEVVREERRRRLENERAMLLKRTEDNVREFDSAIEDFRVDRHLILADLKQSELKLLILFQEFQLLQTFEARDVALQQKQLRCLGEKSEVQSATSDNTAKLEIKFDEMKQWNDKAACVLAEMKALIPDNHPFVDTLLKIFKKKIKRKKLGADGDMDEDEDDDEGDEDDDDEEEVDDSCPIGCDSLVHEKVLELREKRLDVEDVINDTQKNLDELKRAIDRLKQREKQIAKDEQMAEAEMQLFQLQKQAAVNQIEVVVPLRLSQIYAFGSSGVMTGPSDQPAPTETAGDDIRDALDDLQDVDRRQLVVDITLNSHVLFSKKTLERLDNRIDELHNECDSARDSFQELHKERVRMNKEKELRSEEIEEWQRKCNNLQMLKFGRVIDLDEVEAGIDRAKDEKAEVAITDHGASYRRHVEKLEKEIEAIRENVSKTTVQNTKLLNSVAELTENKLDITRDLNRMDSTTPQESQMDDYREKEERKKIASYIQMQAKEIEALRVELFMLKRKDITSLTMPPIPSPNLSSSQPIPPPSGTSSPPVILPPIFSSSMK